jgi:hypothetical protein
MPPVIDATAGSPDANSYVTLAEAGAYFETNVAFAPLWSAMTEQIKTNRLIEAGRAIDRYNFQGSRETGAQAMLFPRIACNDDDDGTVPKPVKDAQCEMLLVKFANSNTTTGASTALGDAVSEFGLGRGSLMVKLTDSRSSGSESVAMGGSIETVETLLAPYIGTGRNSFLVTR